MGTVPFFRMTDWKAIVDRHGGIVWQTVFRLVGNEADASDCFQETFLRAVEIARREAVRDWPALLRHLAATRAMDLLRARCRDRGRTEPLADPDVLAGRGVLPDQSAEAAELSDRLRAALVQLPAQQAEVFCLACLEQWSYGEIAEQLRLTPNAVGVLLHRARRRLRELLISLNPADGTRSVPAT
jgi:RNA polymerase sigma-70 factor, ECF subfamily